jgi:hypothetical protein
MENQKTGFNWRFYHMVKVNWELPQGFCRNAANDGGIIGGCRSEGDLKP